MGFSDHRVDMFNKRQSGVIVADEYQFAFKKDILQLYVQMSLKRQLIITERMVVMFLRVLSISTRHLIT